MSLCAGITLSAQAASRPNIIYINADDLGVMDVGYNNLNFSKPISANFKMKDDSQLRSDNY